ncbi:MAG: protein-glutamate O-methyltransferase CheR, partial [Deltaproteobacteria bacterium]|nr:protein-glutamate O-methyltransferase CheR [Deltaproteobacteria bacterium]
MSSGRQSEPAWLEEACALLDQRVGHRVLERHRPDLAEKVVQLASQSGLASPGQVVERLRSRPLDDPTVRDLLAKVTVNESYFFRDASTMETLRTQVLPRLIESRSRQKLLRVWSAGCSRGEELYSLAILLQECLPDPASWSVTLVGTDVAQSSLEAARAALYSDWSLRTLSPQERDRYFLREGRRWHLRREYRRNATFALQSITTDPAPAPHEFDLLFFRNVAIYLSVEATEAAFERLRQAMAPGAFLVVGPSDPSPPYPWPTEIAPGALYARRPPRDAPAPPAPPPAVAEALPAPAP